MATFRKSGRESTSRLSQRRYAIAKTAGPARAHGEAEVKASEFASVKAKKKCCRSKPRCKRCPLVLHKVHKAELSGIRGKELEKVFKRARKA